MATKTQYPNTDDLIAEFFPPAPIERNERAERLQVYLATRQAVLNGELADGKAVEAMVAAGWSIERAQFHVDAWETLSTLRLMQGERSQGDGVKVVLLQVNNLEDMLWLLTADLDGANDGEANDKTG